MKEGAANAQTGYHIYDGSTSYEQNFKEAAMALENPGDISEPIASDYGYYIIKYESDSVAHDVPLEDVKEKIREILIKEKASEYYEEIYENWKPTGRNCRI